MDRLEANFDSYEILETIGEGTLGTVYRARQVRLNREVAVKFIDGDFAGTFTAAEFSVEAEGLASLCHPNIAMVLDAGSTRGQPFIVTELVDGVTLNEFVSMGPPEKGETVGIMTQVCDALSFAHENGLLHLDLTPEHVILSDLGWIKLVDFRMARPFMSGAKGSRRGAPFLAPELLFDRAVDERSDVYSIGKLLWFLAGSKLPPMHTESGDLDVSGIDDLWKALVEKSTRTDPAERFQSVAEMKAVGCDLVANFV